MQTDNDIQHNKPDILVYDKREKDFFYFFYFNVHIHVNFIYTLIQTQCNLTYI